MKTKNCPNCAAPYEMDKNKCPYCGTSYYDMSAIDFTNHEPFYLKIKTELNGHPVYMTQLVVPSLSSMDFECVQNEYRGHLGNSALAFEQSASITTHIEFTAIADTNNNLLIIES